MSLPGSAAPPAVDRRRDEYALRSGEAVIGLLAKGITARQILTLEAFENAITVVMALGGSTNAVLHLLAIAHEAGVPLGLDDFNRIGDRTPHLADVKPFGRYVMSDIDRVGGIPVVMRLLLDAGLLHGECLTVTGRTDRREPRRASHPPGRPRRRGDPRAGRSRSTRPAAWRSCAARWRRTVPSVKTVPPASTRTVFEGTARVFDTKSTAAMAAVTGAATWWPGRRGGDPLRGTAGRTGHA